MGKHSGLWFQVVIAECMCLVLTAEERERPPRARPLCLTHCAPSSFFLSPSLIPQPSQFFHSPATPLYWFSCCPDFPPDGLSSWKETRGETEERLVSGSSLGTSGAAGLLRCHLVSWKFCFRPEVKCKYLEGETGIQKWGTGAQFQGPCQGQEPHPKPGTRHTLRVNTLCLAPS